MPVKKILFLFLGDIRYDSRCLKIIKSLSKNGYDVSVLIALDESQKGQKYQITGYDAKVIPVYLKRKGRRQPFLQYYVKAFRKIIKHKTDLLFSAELYSLPIAFLASKKFKSPLYYDSRELYSHIAALKNKKLKQWIWKTLEKFIVKRVKKVFTVNESIADILEKELKISKPVVLLNAPNYTTNKNVSSLYALFKIPREQKILLYQGGLQSGRGIPILLDIINDLNEFSLVFLGQGNFQEDIINHKLYNKRIYLSTRITSEKLLEFTSSAFLGMCLIENYGKSYYLSLPNKLFEYCHCQVPVLCSNFPEMERIISKYNIGDSVNPEERDKIIEKIVSLSENNELYNKYKLNCQNAAKELNWENQEESLLKNFNE
jgi:glycosyltransferase involved in cell wall biosynthesis